jgi:hypothetical protein
MNKMPAIGANLVQMAEGAGASTFGGSHTEIEKTIRLSSSARIIEYGMD